MAFNNLQEEELKNRIGELFFSQFDHATIIGKIDFCVTQKQKVKQGTADMLSLLWAEAKRGVVADIYKPLVQLILTIGKARTFDTYLPPPFLAAFDAEKIAFLPYKEILPFFSLNDFNWNVAPSDDTSREFSLLYDAVKATIDRSAYIFRYDSHEKELREFIRVHLSENSELIQINKNNFVSIYQRWLAQVQPSIDVNWELLKKSGLIDGDFFLADLLSSDNQTIKDALFVLLQDDRYVLDRKVDARGLFVAAEVHFKDQQKAHAQFWSIYQRPPKEEYWDYIIKRRDLLVPQDVRERKGSVFTPKIWVNLSQKYLADVLGENWQEEYYVWDCAAGTGNLLNGLTNKYRIWASTLDQQDVDVMKDRIKNGANLLESHVFQFDFLNDEFTKLPQPLQDIINDEEKRKKLVIYINPPYKEAPKFGTIGQKAVEQSNTNTRYANILKQGTRELFAQFYTRIYYELSDVIIASFSTMKILQGAHFVDFRRFFRAKLEKIFLVPAATFDNVKGQFPVGFMIWRSDIQDDPFTLITANVYNSNGDLICNKSIRAYDTTHYMNEWIKPYRSKSGATDLIGKFPFKGNDFQNQQSIQINHPNMAYNVAAGQFLIDVNNLLITCVYFAVRRCIHQTWLNNQDQFVCPTAGWQNDSEFQNNSLTFTLFTNNIQSQYGINHWIPFTEAEVNAKEEFESHFMTDFIAGKLGMQKTEADGLLPQEQQSFIPTEPLVFSPEASAVFDAGRELWRYYHAQPNANPNASYYDIRAHFQGRNEKGKMNPKSDDKEYMRLLGNLKEAMEALRLKIVPKVYEYGFLLP